MLTRPRAFFLPLLIGLSMASTGNATEELGRPANQPDQEVSHPVDGDDSSRASVRSREAVRGSHNELEVLSEEAPSASEESAENADKEESQPSAAERSH